MDRKSQIDNFLLKERKKSFLIILSVVIPVLLFFYLFTDPMSGDSKIVTGEVIGHSIVNKTKIPQHMVVVKIENQGNVLAKIPNYSHYRNGETIVLLERQPSLLGYSIYEYRGYEK